MAILYDTFTELKLSSFTDAGTYVSNYVGISLETHITYMSGIFCHVTFLPSILNAFHDI